VTVVVRAEKDSETIESTTAALVRAWNAGNALAFAGFFTVEADLVNIHGMHLRGRQAIAGIYEMLFRSIFAGSSVRGEVDSLRMLHKNVALVHLKVRLTIRSAPQAGSHNLVTTLVMLHEGSHWQVTSLHNTMVTA
jgi:uncharacterized protein (TIGR02246 family)